MAINVSHQPDFAAPAQTAYGYGGYVGENRLRDFAFNLEQAAQQSMAQQRQHDFATASQLRDQAFSGASQVFSAHNQRGNLLLQQQQQRNMQTFDQIGRERLSLLGRQGQREMAQFQRVANLEAMQFEHAQRQELQQQATEDRMALQEQAMELDANLFEQRLSATQEREATNISQAMEWVQNQDQWSQNQKDEAMWQLRAKLADIRPMPLPKAQSPYPEGQNIGDIWNDEFNNIYTRDQNGIPKLLGQEVIAPPGQREGEVWIDEASGALLTRHQGRAQMLMDPTKNQLDPTKIVDIYRTLLEDSATIDGSNVPNPEKAKSQLFEILDIMDEYQMLQKQKILAGSLRDPLGEPAIAPPPNSVPAPGGAGEDRFHPTPNAGNDGGGF